MLLLLCDCGLYFFFAAFLLPCTNPLAGSLLLESNGGIEKPHSRASGSISQTTRAGPLELWRRFPKKKLMAFGVSNFDAASQSDSQNISSGKSLHSTNGYRT